MKRLLFCLLLLPSICAADIDYQYEVSGGLLGCRALLVNEATCLVEGFGHDVIDLWVILAIYEDEVVTLYQLRQRLYEKNIVFSEPLHWNDGLSPQVYEQTYGRYLNQVKVPD